MATLTGNSIDNTYQGLIKTDDNGAVGATEKQLTDGLGNAIPMTMGTSGVSFTGDADFTNATVNGLSEPGLVNGTGFCSLQNSNSLVNNPTSANGFCAIAIGDGACSTALTVVLGQNACSLDFGVVLGNNATNNTFIGGAIALGRNACVTSVATDGISIGKGALSSAVGAISLGGSSCATASCAVALGEGVTGAKADTVTVKELETCVAGGGIYLTTPDGNAQPKLTVNNSSELLVDGNPVGGASSVGPLYNSVSRYLADEYIIASGSNQGEIGHQVYATSSSTVYPNLQWSRTTTTLTITHNNHGLSQGDTVIIRNANEDNIAVQVDTVPNSNEFTVEVADSGGTSGSNAAYSVGITVSVDKFSDPAVPGVITVSAPANSDVQLLGLTFGDTTEQEIEFLQDPPYVIYTYTKKNEYYLEVPANILAGTGANNSPLNTTIPIWSLHSTALSTGYEIPRCTEQDSSNCLIGTAWLRMFGSSNNYNEYEFGYTDTDSNRLWRFDFS